MSNNGIKLQIVIPERVDDSGSQYGPYHVQEFIIDPDGSGMPWIKQTGEIIESLEGRILLDTKSISDGGPCRKSGDIDWYSPAGVHAKQFSKSAPPETEIMVFSFSETWAGRSWYGNYISKFYSEKK